MKKHLALASVFIGGLSSALSQDCSYSLPGMVSDSATGQPIPFASIQLIRSQNAVTSGETGRFTLRPVCAGSDTLLVSHVGCRTKRIVVDIPVTDTIRIRLAHGIHDLDEVEILSHHHHPEGHGAHSQTIEIDNRTTSSGESLSEMVSQAPGVVSLSSGLNVGKPSIDGMSGSRIGVMQGGSFLENQQWGKEHAPQIDAFAGQEISIVKGASTVKYGGRAAGGLVKVEYPDVFRIHEWEASIGSIWQSNAPGGLLHAALSGQLPRYPALKFRMFWTGFNYADAATPGNRLDNTSQSGQTFTGQMGLSLADHELSVLYSLRDETRGVYTGAHIGNLTDLQRVLNGDAPPVDGSLDFHTDRPKQQVAHEFFQVSDRWRGKRGTLQLRYTRQYNHRLEYDLHTPRGADDDRPGLDLRLTHHTITAEYEHRINEQWKWFSGTEGRIELNNYRFRRFIPVYDKREWAGYAGFEKVGMHLAIQGGLRWDYSRTTPEVTDKRLAGIDSIDRSFSGISGQAGITWYQHTFSLRFTTATSFRPPSPNEMYSLGVHHGAAIIETGDPNLKAEQSWVNYLTFSFGEKDVFNGEIEAYFKYFPNYINLITSGETELTIRGAFPSFYYVQHRARFTGLNPMLRYNITRHITTELSAAILWAQNLEDKQYIFGMPADRLTVKAIAEPKKWKGGQPRLEIAWQWVTEQQKVPDNLASNDNGTGGDFAPPPPAYGLLNASLRWTGKRLTIGISGQNLLNRSYRSYSNFQRYFSLEKGRNIAIQIKWNIHQNKSL